MNETDLELLRRFTRDQAQDAFAELVKRHVHLVYGAALRQVRSPQLAQEIAQSVFADLAQDADKLQADTVLTAWLYAVTRRTAIDVVRKESRRQAREQIAVQMNEVNQRPDVDWTHIEPVLDDAMAELDELDRTAVLLRFFENQSLREVGAALGLGEDAAQKRVSRATDQLREYFSRHGITTTAAGLCLVLSANAIQAAPAALAAQITAAVLAGTTIATTTMLIFQKTIIAAALATAVGAGIYEARQAAHARTEVQTLQQQQAPMAEQVRLLQKDHNDATNRLAGFAEELAKANSNNLELLKLRGEVGVLKRQLAEAKTATIQTGIDAHKQTIAVAHRPGAYIPIKQLAFVGYATPESALETTIWAMTYGTYEQANASLNPEMLTNQLSDARGSKQFEDAQKSAPKMMKGLQITARKVLSDDSVELKIKDDFDAEMMRKLNVGIPPEYMVQPMIKIGNDWKLGGSTHGYHDGWDADGRIETFTP